MSPGGRPRGMAFRRASRAAGLAGALALAAVGAHRVWAQTPPAQGQLRAPAPTADMAAEPRPGAPTSAAVKDVVKDAMKDVAKGVLPAAPAAPPAPAAPAVAPAVVPANDPASRAAALRKKVLRDDDFVDSDDKNRDPFKAFLRLFVEKSASKVRTVPAVFEKFALDELMLIAVVTGDAQPRAMFRDPAGLGQTVKRGEYLSKAGARITKILSDRVIVELSEVTSTGESRPLEKAILLRPEESQQ